MFKFFLIFLIKFFLIINFVFCADLKKGLDAANNKDYETAFNEWLPLAKEGDAWAQYNIGQMYRQGHGLESNSEIAFEWYLKAAKQGLGIAQFAVAASYSNADGVAKDYNEAFKWFNLSARQQNYSAQYQLGRIYYYGAGKEKNNILSHMWVNIASFNGSNDAKDFLISLSEKLDPSDKIIAREMARDCIRSFYINCDNRYSEIEQKDLKNDVKILKNFNSKEIKISKKLELSENVEEIEDNIEKKNKSLSIIKRYKVVASSLSVRSCGSESCGRLRVIPKNYVLKVSEIENNWARISRYYDALCFNGFSPLIERGNKECISKNGITSNKLSEWVSLKYLKLLE